MQMENGRRRGRNARCLPMHENEKGGTDMKKHHVRILSMLIAVIMLIGAMSLTALADGNGIACTDDNCDHVAAIDSMHYDTLQDAVDAVTTATPTTITLRKNAAGNGVVVPSGCNITFDLNSKTYTIDSTVGSTGTETNGFQLLRDSTITFKNGSITSTKAKILIQNYSNLTLDEVTLNGTRLVGSAPLYLIQQLRQRSNSRQQNHGKSRWICF